MMKGKIEWRESNQVCCKRVLLLSSKRKLKRNWILCLSKRSLLAPTGALYVTIGHKHDFLVFLSLQPHGNRCFVFPCLHSFPISKAALGLHTARAL